MQSKNFLPKSHIYKILLFLLFLLLILGLCLFFTFARDWDYRECIPIAAKRIGVEPKMSAIYIWINNNETKGLSRESTRLILERLGLTTFVDSRSISDGTIEDTLRVNICSHPLNNIVLYANYSSDNKLLGIVINDD